MLAVFELSLFMFAEGNAGAITTEDPSQNSGADTMTKHIVSVVEESLSSIRVVKAFARVERCEPGYQTRPVRRARGADRGRHVGLIPRFYDPQSGQVKIDGTDVRNFTVRSLRQRISFVLQETLLFHAPVWQNIAYGKPEATRDEIIRAAKLANADEFIERMPQGYDTMIGERGATRRLSPLEWVAATAIGAFLAWAMGMAPSTLMALNQSGGSSPPPEISDAVKYALASVMGAALGTILGISQWRALRRYVAGASLWVWANAAAWAVGMPMVFIGAGATSAGSSALNIALTVVVTIAAAGASVGAIHGVAPLRLLRQRQEETI
jgi:hypothetical protein